MFLGLHRPRPRPAVFEELRRWTSTEALGDVTVAPDCTSRITQASVSVSVSLTVDSTEEVDAPTLVQDDATDHKLPSPEEQLQVVALHFPAEVVPVDVSGRAFARMSSVRRSTGPEGTVRRRERSRRVRGKRRNTIAACTDKRELEDAVVAGDSANDSLDTSASTSRGRGADLRSRGSDLRSRSSDVLRPKTDVSPPDKRSHLSSLRQWGSAKLRLIRGKSQELHPKSPPMPEDFNIYEAINKGKKSEPRPKTVRSSLPISTPSGAMAMAVKLREGSLRRQRAVSKDEPTHSSSGNWSASSESGRASIGSETTSATPQPRSTTMSSPGTSSQSLHQAPSSVSSRRRFNTSTSSSFSEGTLTPDIGSDLPFVDDGENSSIYSCDTEGYYTSFHLDSGLKPLKEEDTPPTPLHSTTALSRTLSAENEYELFGKGSTSTTASSAGTVCTTLLAGDGSRLSLAPAPAVPERKSSLAPAPRKESPDSGRNTSSSPVDSAGSPHGTLRSCSEFEFSESDFEGVERIERIRVKTTIRSSHIPSMCAITPPQSDDEGAPSPSDKQGGTSDKHEGPSDRHEGPSDRHEGPSDKCDRPSNTHEYATVNKKRVLNKNDLKLDFLASIQSRTIQETHFDVDPSAERDAVTSIPSEEPDVDEGMLDSGDYVTIADVRPAVYANCSEVLGKVRETEYVSLNELAGDSLERRRRQGARVTLDSEGKVVYSSDSLKRVKGHSTFEPGPHVKENASPLPLHRVPKASVRPVNVHAVFPATYTDKTLSPILLRKTQARLSPGSPKPGKVIIRAGSPATRTATVVSPTPSRSVSPRTTVVSPVLRRSVSPRTIVSPTPRRSESPRTVVSPVLRRSVSPGTVVSPVLRRSVSPRTVVSPTPRRSMSPGTVVSPVPRGAYVHVLGSERSTVLPEEEGKIPPCPTNPRQLTSYLQRTNPALFNRINDPNGKVKRSDSYRMANSSILSSSAKKVSNIEIAAQKNNTISVNTFHSDVILETNRLNPIFDDTRKNLMDRMGKDDGNLKAPLAFEEKAIKEVVNPNLLGRKFYGTQIKVDPNIFASSSHQGKETNDNTDKERRSNERKKKDSERARFLDSGNADTEIW